MSRKKLKDTADERPIFAQRLKGAHLVGLSKQLKSPTRLETAYILGVPQVTWYQYGQSNSKDGELPPSMQPIERPSLCLLVRFAFTFPERLQRTIYPEPQALFDKLTQIYPSASYKYFSEMLGREYSAGHRWLKKGNSFDGTTRRLALHFNQHLNEGRLSDWERLITKERQLRDAVGARSLALKEPDKPLDPEYIASTPLDERLLVVGDVEQLQNLCNLTTADSIYHLGLSQRLWSILRKSDDSLPIRDPALCILLRLYLNFPEDLDAVRLPHATVDDVFEAINDPGSGIAGKYKADEIALLLGFSPSIAQRWRYGQQGMDNNYSPLHVRLLSHFYQEVKARRFADWLRLVTVEAETRGINDVLSKGWDR